MGESSGAGVIAILAVIVSLLVGSIVFGFYQKNQSGSEKAGDQLDSMVATLDEQQYTKYDGIEIYGSEVQNVIKSNANNVICITVNNGRSATEYIYNASLTTKSTSKLSDAKKKQNLNTYINPNTKFEGEVVRDTSTDAIMGLKFTKK